MRHSWISLLLPAVGVFGLALGCGDDGPTTVAPPAPPIQDTGQPTDTAQPTDEGNPADPGPQPTDPGPRADPGPTPDTGPLDEWYCVPGNTFCSSNTLFTCDEKGAGYSPTVCDQGCVSGQCKSDCKPGEQKCLSQVSLGTCQADGTYAPQQCPDGPCVEGKCTESNELCTPNALFCEPGGAKVLKCGPNGKSATDQENCKYGCDPDTAACKAAICAPGETRCSPATPKVIEVCAQDALGWESVQECPFECAGGLCQTPVCDKDETKCAPNAILKCKDDQKGWAEVAGCLYGCALGAGDAPVCAVCEAGSKACDTWKITVCNDPLVGYELEKACPFPETCAQGACIDSLVLGSVSTEAADVYLELMKALATCFSAANDGVCSGLNTQKIDFDITLNDLDNWLCGNDAAGALFDSGDQHAAALDLLGCGATLDLVDLSFETGAIHGGLDGVECYAFSSNAFNGKEILIDNCSNL